MSDGAGIRSCVTGAAAGGGLAGFENSLLKASNMDRVAAHTASTPCGQSIENCDGF
jgi:hypothetical protein